MLSSFAIYEEGKELVVFTNPVKREELELNPCGEFFWLERSPGLPISDAIADVLLNFSHKEAQKLAEPV